MPFYKFFIIFSAGILLMGSPIMASVGEIVLLKYDDNNKVTDTSMPSTYLSKMKRSMEFAIEKYDSISVLIDSFNRVLPHGNKNIVDNRKKTSIFILEKMGDGIVFVKNKVDSVALSVAISNFQRRHQLKIDGLFNAKNISLILKDVDQTKIKLKQSLLRLSRLNLPNNTTIFINIPDYQLRVVDHLGASILICPVIVGKPTWPSKTLVSSIDEIVFCPFWNVPDRILKKEILPLISKQKNYLLKHDMEWKNGKLRQRPGKTNALGMIKFVFPNPYHIYLHDTPNKNLFLKNKRAFSHGCIRLFCVNELAKMLLKQDDAWISKRTGNCDDGVESRIKLSNKMPIVIVYVTAWVNEKGFVEVRDDIYSMDK